MNPWPFIIAAYLLTFVGLLSLVGWSLTAMRRSEAEAESLRRRP